MNAITTLKSNKPEDKKSQASTTIRIENHLKSELIKILDELNQKKVGSKKISLSDLIGKSLKLLTDKEKDDLLGSTVTGEDRQAVAFTSYKKKHPKCSKSDFIDLLIYNKIDIESFLPKLMKKNIL